MSTTEDQDTPIEEILHPALRSVRHSDVDDLHKLIQYCESGDKSLLKPLTLDRLDLLYARYGALNLDYTRALSQYRDQLRDERAARLSRREKVGLLVLALLLGALGGLLQGWLKG